MASFSCLKTYFVHGKKELCYFILILSYVMLLKVGYSPSTGTWNTCSDVSYKHVWKKNLLTE